MLERKMLERVFSDHAGHIDSQLLSHNDPHGDGGTLEYQDSIPTFSWPRIHADSWEPGGEVHIWICMTPTPDTGLGSSVLGPCSFGKSRNLFWWEEEILDSLVFTTLVENFSLTLPWLSWYRSMWFFGFFLSLLLHILYYCWLTLKLSLKLSSPMEIFFLVPPLEAHDFWLLIVMIFFFFATLSYCSTGSVFRVLFLYCHLPETLHPDTWLQIHRHTKDCPTFISRPDVSPELKKILHRNFI